MRRIYFLLPEVASARAIVDELLLARVEERHIHIVAREDTPLEDLPEAGVAQRSDLIPAIEKGLAAGGLSGLLAGHGSQRGHIRAACEDDPEWLEAYDDAARDGECHLFHLWPPDPGEDDTVH